MSQQLERRYLAAIRYGDGVQAKAVIDQALAALLTVAEVYTQVITPAMATVGELWARQAMTAGQEHLATAISFARLEDLRRSAPRPEPISAIALLAAVGGEEHVLGLQMVNDVLEMAGYATLLLGANTPPADIAELAGTWKPVILCLSATLGQNLVAAATTIELVRQVLPHQPIVLAGQAGEQLGHELGCDLASLTDRAGLHVAPIGKLLQALAPAPLA